MNVPASQQSAARMVNKRLLLASMKDLKLKAPEEFKAFMSALVPHLDLEMQRLLHADQTMMQRQQGRAAALYELMEELDNCQQWSVIAETQHQAIERQKNAKKDLKHA